MNQGVCLCKQPNESHSAWRFYFKNPFICPPEFQRLKALASSRFRTFRHAVFNSISQTSGDTYFLFLEKYLL